MFTTILTKLGVKGVLVIALLVLSLVAILYVKYLQDTLSKTEKQVVELQLQQKENLATITVLKLQADQMQQIEKHSREVTEWLNQLTPQQEEAMNTNEAKAINHYLFSYFRDRVPLQGQSNRSAVPGTTTTR